MIFIEQSISQMLEFISNKIRVVFFFFANGRKASFGDIFVCVCERKKFDLAAAFCNKPAL